jgi:hypothetical protein
MLLLSQIRSCITACAIHEPLVTGLMIFSTQSRCVCVLVEQLCITFCVYTDSTDSTEHTQYLHKWNSCVQHFVWLVTASKHTHTHTHTQCYTQMELLCIAFCMSTDYWEAWGSIVVKALRYKSEGPRINSRCHRGFFHGIWHFYVPWGWLSL